MAEQAWFSFSFFYYEPSATAAILQGDVFVICYEDPGMMEMLANFAHLIKSPWGMDDKGSRKGLKWAVQTFFNPCNCWISDVS